MQAAIRAFVDTHQLPLHLVDELVSLFEQLSHSADSFQDLGALAEGGMGEVRRVRDVSLDRTLAMKTLHPHLLESPSAVSRFLAEARITAQLQPPAGCGRTRWSSSVFRSRTNSSLRFSMISSPRDARTRRFATCLGRDRGTTRTAMR